MEAVTTPQQSTETLDEFDGAQIIAETLRDTAAKMPLDSEIRGIALRTAERWHIIAGTRPVSLVARPRGES